MVGNSGDWDRARGLCVLILGPWRKEGGYQSIRCWGIHHSAVFNRMAYFVWRGEFNVVAVGIVRIDCGGCGDYWTGLGEKAKWMREFNSRSRMGQIMTALGFQFSALQTNSIFIEPY